MNTNPLHNAMIKYVYEKQLMILASNPGSWWRFKKIEGVKVAHNHTVADLAKIFRSEILPNILDYEYVASDPLVSAYIGPFNIVISDSGFNLNDYPNISYRNVFEALRNKDERQDNLDVTCPIVTDDIISLSHIVSTPTEIERGSVLSINEMVARLRYIQNERGNGVNLQIPTLESIKNYHETVAATHNIDGAVRLSDIMEKNPKPVTPQNLPLILLDSNSLPEQTGSVHTHQHLSIFGISDASVSCAEQRPPADHHRYSDILQSTTVDSCNPDLDSNPSSTVNESVSQIVEIPPQETTANELQTIANVDMDEIPSGNLDKATPDGIMNDQRATNSFSALNWEDLPTCNASSRVAIKKQRPLTSKASRSQKLSPKLLSDGARASRPFKDSPPSKSQVERARPAIPLTTPPQHSTTTVAPLATKRDCSIAPIAQGGCFNAQSVISGTQLDRSPPTDLLFKSVE